MTPDLVTTGGTTLGRAGRVLKGRAGRVLKEHKIATAIGGVFAAAIIAVSILSSQPGSSPPHPLAHGFTLTALGAPGQHVSLSQYQGKPVIVNFWASWCEPCQQETPLIARWYSQQHGHVNVVGIDVNDNSANAVKFAQSKGVSYPVGVDTIAATVAGEYGVIALPQTFFLNAQHSIVDRVYGAVTQADLDNGVRLMDANGS